MNILGNKTDAGTGFLNPFENEGGIYVEINGCGYGETEQWAM